MFLQNPDEVNLFIRMRGGERIFPIFIQTCLFQSLLVQEVIFEYGSEASVRENRRFLLTVYIR